MTLYEIDQAITGLVDQETGELLNYEAFATLQMERDAKIENMALYIKNLEAEAAEIKAEEARLKDRRQTKENKAKRLREYLSMALDGEKFETARCAVSFRKATAVEVKDQSETVRWLEENGYMDFVTYGAPTIDKRGVTGLLKCGDVVPGAELVSRTSVQVK